MLLLRNEEVEGAGSDMQRYYAAITNNGYRILTYEVSVDLVLELY